MRARIRGSLYGPLAVIMALTMIGTPATAAPVVFGFRGIVTNVFDGLGSLPPAVGPGRTFLGAYVFDSETPNTGEPIGEGERGIYHHDRPPAGVFLSVGPAIFASNRRDLDFDIIVTNDFGFAGPDGYGFASGSNVAWGLLNQHFDRLDLAWFADTFRNDLFSTVDLPLTPPSLKVLGGGTLTVEGECTPCASPAAFFRITGTMTSWYALPRIPFGLGFFATQQDRFFSSEPSLADRDMSRTVAEPWGIGWLLLVGICASRAWRRSTR